MLIDEVESLTCSREKVISAGEPTDSIRAVNALLTQLDKISSIENIFVFATSNLISHIDAAFLDRIDLKVHLGNPNAVQIYSILREGILELVRVGVVTLNHNENWITLLEAKHLEIEDLLHDNPYSNELYQIAEGLSKKDVSGRKVKKIIIVTLSKLTRYKFPIAFNNYIEKLADGKEMI